MGSIVGLLVLIGGITLYRTFALYEEKKEFNILQGRIPDFATRDIELAVTVDGVSTTEVPWGPADSYNVTVTCDNGATGTWDYKEWGPNIRNINGSKIKCSLDFVHTAGTLNNVKFRDLSNGTRITKIVFENKLVPHETQYFVDISHGETGNVMAYIVMEDENSGTSTLYVQSNEKVYANEDSSGLFSGLSELVDIENLDLLDTSKVTNMRDMFAGTYRLKSLDLSSFNLEQVRDMSKMFFQSALSTLNFGEVKNAPNVERMNRMFTEMENLENLNLKIVNTYSLRDVESMFEACPNLTNLSLEGLVTENVRIFGQTFRDCTKLQTINYGPNFILNPSINASDVLGMFYNCPSNRPTDPSWNRVTFN